MFRVCSTILSIKMCAASAGSLETVELLLLNGADLEYSLGNADAERLARRNKQFAVIDCIADFRRDLNLLQLLLIHPRFRAKQIEDQQRVEPELINELYCKLCDVSHFDPSHDTRITHLVNLNERPDEGYAYGIPITNVGYRLLKKGQWMEGKGLGKEKDGRKYPVSLFTLYHFCVNF